MHVVGHACVCVRVQAKVNQAAEQVVRDAMEEARRAGLGEDEVKLAGERAATDFKAENELLKKSVNSDGDAQSR